MTKRWDIRGMNLDQVMAVSAETLDEIFEEMVDNAGKLCRELGGTEDEIESMRELQRQWLTQGREEQLAKLRAWLQRGCESLQ